MKVNLTPVEDRKFSKITPNFRFPLKGNLLLWHISLNNYLTKSSQNANFSTEVQSLNQDFSEMTAS